MTKDTAEIRDPEGRVLVRYANGSAEVFAPTGDLTLAAPEGRVVLRSGTDVEIEARRDVVETVGRRRSLTAERIDVKANESHVTSARATILAERIATTATTIAQSAERIEVSATRFVEKTRDVLRETLGIVEQRFGRVRTIVDDTIHQSARRTQIVSTDETSIDGKKVLLG